MYIPGMQGEKVALKIGVLALHGRHMAFDFVHHIIDGGLWICKHIPVTRLLKTLGRKIYLETP
jgi:hypothetical protein